MGSESTNQVATIRRLKTLACDVKFSGGNTLLHQFVLDNSSDPSNSGIENYINAVLMSMSDAPGKVVNALNNDGYSALHLAVFKENLLMVKKLLSCLRNIDVDARIVRGRFKPHDGQTSLHLAAELGNVSIMQELFDKGADGDSGAWGDSTLYFAMMSKRVDATKLLVSRGADVNLRFSIEERTAPLHEAARWGSLDMVRFLLDNRADINLRNWSGETPLHNAIESGNLECAAFLIGRGADLDATDRFERTMLHCAAICRNLEMVKLLIGKFAADLHAADREGKTPLHCALEKGDLECAEFLIDQGANLGANRHGWTALHFAAYHGHAEFVRLLLDKGVDADARIFTYRRTALDLAKEFGKQACIDVLQNVRQC